MQMSRRVVGRFIVLRAFSEATARCRCLHPLIAFLSSRSYAAISGDTRPSLVSFPCSLTAHGQRSVDESPDPGVVNEDHPLTHPRPTLSPFEDFQLHPYRFYVDPTLSYAHKNLTTSGVGQPPGGDTRETLIHVYKYKPDTVTSNSIVHSRFPLLLSLSPLHVSLPQLLLLRPLIPNPYLRPRFPLPQSRSPVMARRVLVTGGAGYIGSHTVLQLLLEGFSVVVVDNLDNSSVVAVQRVAQLAGEFGKNLAFHRVIVVYCCVTRGGDWFDIRDKEALEKVFATSKFDAVIHFAGLKAVGESVQKPLIYYKNNIIVYGMGTSIGTQRHSRKATLVQVRDYIHVVDLADGHIAALQKFFEDPNIVYNLGTGKGTSVLEMVAVFEKASGKKIPLVMAGRRPGDAETLYACTVKAEKELSWKAKYGIEEMCRDQWNWATKNPWGYRSPDPPN
ncbi:hypothetical protein B296_00003762 [Ensete ventricosum]|uniref:UDP-glucose 4-epimerase n=1 Tax=Ensete ventricosum TaxID=4639 RepID=A0A427BCI7_ENSVE|nr:hypothetical protein B296_00003762 [Ensete ventricosum]